MGPFSFSPGLVTTVAAALAFALLASLGRWQVARAHEKEERQALFDARAREAPVVLAGAVASAEPLLYRHVRAAGRWIADRQVFIDNQVRDGRAGFFVVAPLLLANGRDAVLVNRGWIARGAQYPAAPAAPPPPGIVEVEGIASLPPARFIELSAETVAGDVWQNLSIERYRERTGLAVLPFVILDRHPSGGLAAVQDQPDAGAARHREYALTWFSLAATVLALWLALNTRRTR
jgi:surfeit locus 1 family protein